ncbi:MAG: hypothetical protein HKL95_09195 [Phycisphaerae bacterium]|nr:hypothetical protein [Phycisphaerae bacterium]
MKRVIEITDGLILGRKQTDIIGPLRNMLLRSSGRRLLALIWIAAGTLALATAHGQVQVQNGQALDANNQVGSGGSNATIPGYVPFNGNQYMNNVNSTAHTSYQTVPITLPGGGVTYARIPIVTSAPPSYSSPPGALPINNYSNVGNVTGSGSRINATINGVYSPSSLGMTGQNGLGQNSAIYNGPVPVGPASPFASIYGNPASPISPRTIGLAQNGLIAPTGSKVNSLFGLREIPIQQQAGYARLTGAVNQNPHKGPAMIPGQQSQKEQTHRPNGAATGTTPLNGVIQATHIGKPLGTKNNAQVNAGGVGDVYQNLLHELQTGEKINIVAPGLPGQPAMTLTNLEPQSAAAQRMVTIDPITGLPIMNPSAHVVAGLAGHHGKGPHGKKSTAVAKLWNRANAVTIPKKLGAELQAGRNLMPLQALAGNMTDKFDRGMAYGQKLIDSGRFMQAVQAFQGALAMRPGNPLAIIGQAHAEIAAGLYGSAAYNLQFVFNSNPALNAVRLNLKKLIPAASLRAARRELKTLAKRDNPAAAMLLAYVDYQLGYRRQLRHTLTQWVEFQPRSIWPRILRKAWLEKPVAAPAKVHKP